MARLVHGRMTLVRLVAIAIGAAMGFFVSLSDLEAPSDGLSKSPHGRRFRRLSQSWQPPPIAYKPGPLDLNEGIIITENQKSSDTKSQKEPPKELFTFDKKDKVVNKHDYNYTIDPKQSCSDKKIFLVAYVHTSPDHKDRRDLIRRTWANRTLYLPTRIRVFFVIGRPVTARTQAELQKEAKQHGDIIQENYVDAYHNLSIKAVGALRWVTSRCKQAKFVVKTDDDVFVNLFGLLPHLHDLHTHKVNNTGLLMCLVWYKMHVLREGKWAIPKEVVPDVYYPPYCSGMGYVMSLDVANAIYRAAAYVPFFWVDDVYITGMIPKAIGLKHVDVGKLVFGRKEIEWLLSGDDWYKYLFSHIHDMKYFERMWRLLERRARNETVPKMKEIVAGKLAASYGPKKPPDWFLKQHADSRPKQADNGKKPSKKVGASKINNKHDSKQFKKSA